MRKNSQKSEQKSSQVINEHVVMDEMLSHIESLFSKPSERAELREALDAFEEFWKAHEEMEEEHFGKIAVNGKKFPYRKTLVKEHVALKGHWKVLNDFLERKSDLELQIALETDGKMIVDKFREHMRNEEEFLNKLR